MHQYGSLLSRHFRVETELLHDVYVLDAFTLAYGYCSNTSINHTDLHAFEAREPELVVAFFPDRFLHFILDVHAVI